MKVRNKDEILGYPREDEDRNKNAVGKGRSIFNNYISVYFRSLGFGEGIYVMSGKYQCCDRSRVSFTQGKAPWLLLQLPEV